jgi:putative membrane protein
MLFALISLAVFAGILDVPFRWSMIFFLAVLPFAFAVLHASQTVGWRPALLLLFLTVTVSLFFESVGVLTGWIYGSYYYTSVLGPRLLGLVPYSVPVVWFTIAYPSYVIAEWLVPVQWGLCQRRLAVATMGALVMTVTDVILDPIMVAAGCWVWNADGTFFGVPVQNYFGWFITTFTILILFLWLGKLRSKHPLGGSILFDRLVVVGHIINGFAAVGTALYMGLKGTALTGLFIIGLWLAVTLCVMRETPPKSPHVTSATQQDVAQT